MKTIPRYIPAIDLHARFAAFSTDDPIAAVTRIKTILGLLPEHNVTAVPSGRYGLVQYFAALASRDHRRAVLVSAQICPIVPRLLLQLGYRPIFVDIEPDVPTVGPQHLTSAFLEAGGADTIAAIVLAPAYGYAPRTLDSLANDFSKVNVVLDLAQGALLGRCLPALMARADAILFSFSVGKGLDIGGGLLAVRSAESQLPPMRQNWTFNTLVGIPSALVFQAAAAIGLYRVLIKIIEDRISADSTNIPDIDASAELELPASIFPAYAARLYTFVDEVALAQQRATALYTNATIANNCKFADVFGSSEQMHLRQLIRLNDFRRRDNILMMLRDAGIDAMSAGEPLPADYLDRTEFESWPSNGNFFNAKQFLSDSIRLPFLGRVNEISFAHLVSTLEKALD